MLTNKLPSEPPFAKCASYLLPTQPHPSIFCSISRKATIAITWIGQIITVWPAHRSSSQLTQWHRTSISRPPPLKFVRILRHAMNGHHLSNQIDLMLLSLHNQLMSPAIAVPILATCACASGVRSAAEPAHRARCQSAIMRSKRQPVLPFKQTGRMSTISKGLGDDGKTCYRMASSA
eukprot:scaffold90407_cov50-Prasinocladus_malaysianus.AAC.1